VCPAEQVDISPLQSPLFRHSTQTRSPVSHFGVPPLQSASPRQPTQVFGLAAVLHTGRPGTLAQSAALAHSAQFPETQAAAVALVQLASDAHSTQAADTQYGSTPAQATHTPPPPPQALGVPPGRQVPALTQPVQHAPALQTPSTPPVVQETVLGMCVQTPLAGVHASVVHTLASAQSLAAPARHEPPRH